jgi:hypothetical protein
MVIAAPTPRAKCGRHEPSDDDEREHPEQRECDRLKNAEDRFHAFFRIVRTGAEGSMFGARRFRTQV